MCELKAPADVPGDGHRPFQGHPIVGGSLYQPLHVAWHNRQHHVGLPLLIAQVVDRHDVGVIPQAAHGLGLPSDAAARAVVQAGGLDEGKRHVPVQGGVIC